jgi:23S rRNA G2445 N2-methylase RlmL
MCLSRERAVDGLQWDALAPCLRPASVDVLISDLPFGKRSGSKADNRVLYPATLLAMARLVRPTTGIVLGYLKGTVSRDFRLLVFFMIQFPPSP